MTSLKGQTVFGKAVRTKRDKYQADTPGPANYDNFLNTSSSKFAKGKNATIGNFSPSSQRNLMLESPGPDSYENSPRSNNSMYRTT